MNFGSYLELKKKAKKVGIEDSPSLKRLLHIIQAKDVAIRHYEAYLNDMNKWEIKCAEIVEEEIRRAGERNERTD